MSRLEENKLKMLIFAGLFKKNKIILFLMFCFIGAFSFSFKAKALAPLALWGIGALVAYFGGEAVNYGMGGVENTLTAKAIKGPVGDGLAAIFSWLLYAVNFVISWLIQAAALMLETSLKPDLFNTLIKGDGVYSAWALIRDFLNMFFMLILLFSAFATIFQVEKYHLRKIIIMLVVMALLVNFSYPISLFIVDFSNSAMYFLVDGFFSSAGTQSGGAILSKSTIIMELMGIAKLYEKLGTGHEMVAALMVLIIVNFIVFITLFSYAVSLFVRMVALVILVAVSPIGFTLSFFPATKGYSDKWWDNMISYAIKGPLLIFFLILAIVTIGSPDATFLNSTSEEKSINVPALIAYLILPVTFLWAGLIASQQMGGAASSMAMGSLKKVGNNIKSYGQKAAWGGFAATGIPGAAKERYNNIKGKFDGKREEREAKLSKLFGSKDAMDKLERKNYEEDSKKMKNFTVSDLETKAKTGNVAAANELLSRKALNEDVYNETIKNSKDTKRKDDLTAKFKGASKENRIDVVASIDASDPVKINAYMTSHGVNEATAKTELFKEEVDKKFGGLNHVEFAKQDWKKIFDNIAVLRTQGRGVDADAIKNAIEDSFLGLDARAVAEITKNINSNQASALRGAGII